MKFICRMYGHNMKCQQEVLLYPGRGGLVFHEHRCTRCRENQPFQTGGLDPDWEFEIRSALPEVTVPTKVLLAPEHPIARRR